MVPVWVHFPAEKRFYDAEDHFLVGRDLLVRPVTAKGEVRAAVSFPAPGPW